MTPEQVKLVKSTWSQVSPIREAAAGLFYQRLFELDPTVRGLFRGDMKEQGHKLMAMIGMAVTGLDHMAELVPSVEKLGRRHAGYGVTDAHYDTVASALLWTLEKGLGPAFTAEAREAWTAVYATLSTVMRRGAAAAA